jgi:hypothetical protein
LSALGIGGHVKTTSLGGEKRTKDCCDPQNGVTKDGLQETEGQFELAAELKGLTLWGPPTITREFDFGVAIISVDIEVGVKIDNNAKLTISGGERVDRCKGDDCAFAGVNSGLTIEPKATLEAIGCGETFWTTKLCGGLNVTPLSVEINFQAGINYNKNTCKDGLTGNVTIGQIVAKSTFSIGLPPVASVGFKYEIFPGQQF